VPWVRQQLGIDPGGNPEEDSSISSSGSSSGIGLAENELHTRGSSLGSISSAPATTPVLTPCARHMLLVLLQWMGVPLAQVAPAPASDAAGTLAGLLGLKAGLVAVAAVRRQAWLWAAQVPAEARAAAQPGRPCCLLWPQDRAPPEVSGSRRTSIESPRTAEAGQQQQGGRQSTVSPPPSGMQSPFWSAPWASLAAGGGGAVGDSWGGDGVELGSERDGEGSVQSFVTPLRSLVSSMAAALGQGAVSVMGSPEEQEVGREVGGRSLMGWDEVERRLGEGPGLPGNVAWVQQGEQGLQTGQSGVAVHLPVVEQGRERGGLQQGGSHAGVREEDGHGTSSSGELVEGPDEGGVQSDTQGAAQPHPSQHEQRAREAGTLLPKSATPSAAAEAGAVVSDSPPAGMSRRPVVVLTRQQYLRLLAGVLCRRAEGFWT
ncbi:hypothetical protein DUNSADRAFT_6897, partial [Dunaliella salina]